MAKQTNRDRRDRLEKFLSTSGWAKDHFGHYQKELPSGTKLRVKMQATSCRLEKQVKIVDKNEWLRVDGAYYKNIRFELGDLFVGSKRLKKD